MTISKSRGASKKLGPVSTGSRIVRFDIPNLTRRFTVHEDLICRSSKYFQSRLQKHRKRVTASCSICLNDLNAATKEITFCDKCGQNFHEDCIDRWTADRTRTHQTATCPMCRGIWTDKASTNLERFHIGQEVHGQAVQIYFDWLYSGTINIDAALSRTTDAFDVVLLQCWEVSDAVEDEAFRNAVIQTFFDEAKAHFWSKSIKFVFLDDKGSDAMRDFVMDVFLTEVGNDWFESESAKWPDIFVKKLADHCLTSYMSGQRMKSYDEIEATYLGSKADVDEERWETWYRKVKTSMISHCQS